MPRNSRIRIKYSQCKCLRRKCQEIVESGLNIVSVVFVQVAALWTKFHFEANLKKHLENAKDIFACVVDFEKDMTGFLR